MNTRRTFLNAAFAAPAVLSAQSPNDTVRVALIGVGTRGAYLLRHILDVPGVKVIAICDNTPEHLDAAIKQAASKGHTATGYADFRKMLDERKDIDAVLIATPVDTHKGISIAALEVGKHVYCEKPMAVTPEDATVMVKAASSAKGIFQAGFQLRHDPRRRASMEFIQKGGLGRILYLHGIRHGGDLQRTRDWYFQRERSGDMIVEQACHILDLFTWAIGKPPLRAFGSGGINLYKNVPPGRTTMDNYSVIYEFPDDVRVNFSHHYFDPPGFSGIKERIWGEKGAIDLALATWYELDKRGEHKLEVPDEKKDSTYAALEAFIDNARAKRKPLNNAESGRLSTLVAILGRKAIYEKRIVTWEELNAV